MRPGSSPAGLCPACLLASALSETGTLDLAGNDPVAGLPPGTVFGPFRIRQPLGRGGMAVVYDALDTRLDRAVALKTLPPEFLHDQTFAKRFEEEARLVAKLEHPNIVPIYASGIDDGIPWMSMRLIAGGNLGTVLERRRLLPAEAVQVLRQVADALDYAHAQGVVHRDIKPANILLHGSNQICVADFGLAQMLGAGHRLTQTGMLTGTPHYMAPEQALGKTVDRRCDIYSMGIVAYEMLVGTIPFAAESPVAVLLQHVHEPLPLVTDERLPCPWMAAVQKAAAKDPEDRWPTAGAFADALEASIAAPTVGSIAGRTGFPQPYSRLSLTSWSAAAGGVLLAAAGLVWAAGGYPAPVPADLPAPSAPKRQDVVLPSIPAPTLHAEPTGSRPGRAKPPARPKAPAPSRQSTPLPPVPASGPSPQPVDLPAPPSPGALLLPPGTSTPIATPPHLPSSSADVVTKPVLVRAPQEYPEVAQAAQLEGDVIVSGIVGIDGKVRDIKIVRSVHPLLDGAARNAVLRYEYRPSLRNGTPVPHGIRITVSFRLPDLELSISPDILVTPNAHL
jgi:TonB family protein